MRNPWRNALLMWALVGALSFARFAASVAGIPAATSQNPPASDQANAVVLGSFAGTGVSPSILITGTFNLVLYGSSGPNGSWNATVRIERSFDGGTTWLVAGVGGGGQQAIYSTPNQDVSVVASEPEKGMLYRLNCTVYASGPVNYRMSTTSPNATTGSP